MALGSGGYLDVLSGSTRFNSLLKALPKTLDFGRKLAMLHPS
jgi:hypothetical protein